MRNSSTTREDPRWLAGFHTPATSLLFSSHTSGHLPDLAGSTAAPVAHQTTYSACQPHTTRAPSSSKMATLSRTAAGKAAAVADQVEDDPRPVQSIPILQRLPTSKLRTYALVFLFVALLLPIHLAQLFFYPLSFVPGGIRELYWFGVESSKCSFGRMLLLITKPTSLVITAGEGVDLDKVCKKDEDSGKWVLELEDRAGKSCSVRRECAEES